MLHRAWAEVGRPGWSRLCMEVHEVEVVKQRRGFACMSPEKRREIAAKGGAGVPKDKRSFAKVPGLAAAAGAKGGAASAAARRLVAAE